MKTWRHPGGKPRELGSESLTDAELLSILISTGTKGKSAEDVVKEVIDRFGSFKGMTNQLLNSPVLDQLIKPMQSRGLFGLRDIHKKIWELPIPEFDPSNEKHLEPARLGEECTKKVSKLLSKGIPQKSIGNLRKTDKGRN